MRPINLALRFALELATLAAYGAWGLHAAGVALGGTGHGLLGGALAVVAVANAGLLRLLHHETVPSREGRR